MRSRDMSFQSLGKKRHDDFRHLEKKNHEHVHSQTRRNLRLSIKEIMNSVRKTLEK